MRLSDRCFAVTGLGYIPPWSVNAGLIAGSEITLIVDTGSNAAAAGTIHGYASAVRPGNQLRVINTERHFDHIGGNGYFRELGIDVYGHANIRRTEDEFRNEIAEFNARIPDPVRRAREEARAFYAATRQVNPNRPIDQDTRMDLGDCEVEILLTPGHTPTNLSVWAPREGVLFCGDCLVNEYLPNLDAGGPREWRQWLHSLDRIAQLAPTVVMCGHGPVARGGQVANLIGSVRSVLEQAIANGFSPTSAAAARSAG
ncbi:MAG TPA: MBL fold metallo-hydrolase [Bryobacteraceae bacterium]|nr:MBL fold metallo-hydrolase [Bryobacteraceae bacterium]